MTSINIIPVEVLGEIFLTCYANEIRTSPFINQKHCTRKAPMLLTHVCRLWRAICFTLPTLWSSLDLSFTVSQENQEALLSHWLTHSGSACPLDVDASSRGFDKEFISPDIIARIQAESHRWRMVYLKPEDGILEEFISAPRGTPMLKALKVDQMPLRSESFRSTLPRLMSAVASSSSLQQLRLRRIRGVVDVSEFIAQLPLERLTHLNLEFSDGLPFHNGIDILRRSRQAEQIVLEEIQYTLKDQLSTPRELPAGEQPFDLPLLNSLLLTVLDVPLGVIFRHFRCPSLVTLYICDSRNQAPEHRTGDSDLVVLDSFCQEARLQQLTACFGREDAWTVIKKLLAVSPIQSIPEVEMRVLYVYEPDAPVILDSRYRCPAIDCVQPHVGWGKLGRSLHLGEVDELGHPSNHVNLALWQIGCETPTQATKRASQWRKCKFVDSLIPGCMEARYDAEDW